MLKYLYFFSVRLIIKNEKPINEIAKSGKNGPVNNKKGRNTKNDS